MFLYTPVRATGSTSRPVSSRTSRRRPSGISDSGVPVETIAQLVGHAGGSQVTETIYLKQIRPVLLGGAEAMNRIFTPPVR